MAALTFDDGPSIPFTSDILDILKKHQVKATFFLLGNRAEQQPELVKRIYREGHEIGNHSWSHKRFIFKTPSFIREEIDKTDNLIRELGYTGTIHFRAPYGNKFLVLPWILHKMNRPHILFDVIAKDWEFPPPQLITDRIIEQLHPGAIIVLHDGDGDHFVDPETRINTVDSLESLIKETRANGYQLVTISELLKQE